MLALVLLSGPVAVGKSAVARELIKGHQFGSIRTGQYLVGQAQQKGLGGSRAELQLLGDTLDEQTDYRWVVDVAAAAMAGTSDLGRWLFDCVRKQRQVEHFRKRFDPYVLHVHLTAPEEVLRDRYERRIQTGGEYIGNTPYAVAINHPNEIAARALIGIADQALDLCQMSPTKAAAAIQMECNLRIG